MCRRSGFTLIEIAICVAILLMLMLLAVPSVSGVLADRRLRHSLDEFNKLVQQAQERSVLEHRAYLISWEKESVVLGPETPAKGEGPLAVFKLARGEAIQLNLTAALTKEA